MMIIQQIPQKIYQASPNDYVDVFGPFDSYLKHFFRPPGTSFYKCQINTKPYILQTSKAGLEPAKESLSSFQNYRVKWEIRIPAKSASRCTAFPGIHCCLFLFFFFSLRNGEYLERIKKKKKRFGSKKIN